MAAPAKDGLGEVLFQPKSGAEVDIVFVHGLGGDRIKTWTWDDDKERAQFWPKDLLPKACPTARILSFGYNADFAHFYPFFGPKNISKQLTIENHSTALLQSLIGLREKTKTTELPIIFVAHSLGGLVVANALSRPAGTDEASIKLVEKTVGTLFLGTPFEGSSKAKWGSRALQLVECFSTTQKEDMKDLEERSNTLIRINDSFQKLLKARDRSGSNLWVEVACFFEEYSVYKKKAKIGIIVPKESASLPGFDAQSIAANHLDMCKYEDEDRPGYKSVSEKLIQWIGGIGKEGKGPKGNAQNIGVHMGDVKYDKVDNKGGVVMGHAYGTTEDAIKITGTSNVYYGYNPKDVSRNDD